MSGVRPPTSSKPGRSGVASVRLREGFPTDSLQEGEDREAAVAGEDRRDSVQLGARTIHDPSAVAVDDLTASLLVDRKGPFPGRHRLRDDVLAVDDVEAVPSSSPRWERTALSVRLSVDGGFVCRARSEKPMRPPGRKTR